ncbi:CRISPR-associated endoribonuclease Cas6 [Amycolatopsis anabasis]|uniref:CRISPR-associated endoribonuclease Cas6 n=1 Tax=Amycolatopsis anabasis TaxID=1840409 RepID=UPI001FE4A628|nr:CRISPR-associated endoribonuclease Cas6 [Amycolatopsis anabasis]
MLKPGRAIVYEALRRAHPELGDQLHEQGWGSRRMRPFGYSPPRFPGARRRRGVYRAGGNGTVEIGSPLVEIVQAIANGLAEEKVWDWGGVALQVHAITPVFPPQFGSGRARFRTLTPMVLKGPNRDATGARTDKQNWLLPGEPEWPAYFEQNLKRKAETLELDPDVTLEQVHFIGCKRSFAVGQGAKVCAGVEVELSGPPRTLQAIHDWGLGQDTSAGFGWVRR